MSMTAAGAYFRALREARGLSRAQVAAAISTDQSQIVRIESGEIDTRGSLLMALIDVVQGDIQQVKQLLLSKEATAQDGRRMAEELLTGLGKQGRVAHGPDRVQQLVQELILLPQDELVDVLIRIQTQRQT